MAQRRVTDVAAAPEPVGGLAGLAVNCKPGDTDFSWTRATGWRSLLAAALAPPHEGGMGGGVAAGEGKPTAALLAARLSPKLNTPLITTTPPGPRITRVPIHLRAHHNPA